MPKTEHEEPARCKGPGTI